MAKGIIFSAPMVIANRDGRKSQTRRLCKLANDLARDHRRVRVVPDKDCVGSFRLSRDAMHTPFLHERFVLTPRYQPGDVVYVKETWALYASALSPEQNFGVKYRADGEIRYYPEWDKSMQAHCQRNPRWRSPIHMPAWAARDWIKIKAVRVERVQDISEDDVKAEGIRYSDGGPLHWHVDRHDEIWWVQNFATAEEAYAALIDSIHGPGTWESNPWVWVYEFEKAEAAKETN